MTVDIQKVFTVPITYFFNYGFDIILKIQAKQLLIYQQ